MSKRKVSQPWSGRSSKRIDLRAVGLDFIVHIDTEELPAFFASLSKTDYQFVVEAAESGDPIRIQKAQELLAERLMEWTIARNKS